MNNHAEALLTNDVFAWRVFATEPELTHFGQTKRCQTLAAVRLLDQAFNELCLRDVGDIQEQRYWLAWW